MLVIATGPLNVADSLIQDTPVISPLPFWAWKPAAWGMRESGGEHWPTARADGAGRRRRAEIARVLFRRMSLFLQMHHYRNCKLIA